ncbi:Cytochrome c oxidase assembly protein [Lasiodiplodia theobromae]|uniref:Mitochondrial protein n=1 Tax=Lasiodiplodia theobromae TaxID=45133 RepID=A0A5N5CV00_9PEZI|nr:Cytochrome c oxidase assembly protein [Lasiodiplodia theobromae]KAB2569178.1 Mitochondrial protein [Lasiodiplodia theobromae]KAF4541438.1 Cytochrome c oxidase assembly protein [Lasiodiplodia theobromae]
MPSSCKDIRAALAECLQNSDCIMVQRNSPSDCLRPPLSDTLPTRCQQLKKGYGECKRGMVDMRKRFRGNKPVGVMSSTELDVQGKTDEKKGGQLYAGKPLFDVIKGTDGNEDSKSSGEGR